MKSKIQCTVGPTLNTVDKIAQILNEGISTIRINFSHGKPEDHKFYCNLIRQASEKCGRKVTIMGDI